MGEEHARTSISSCCLEEGLLSVRLEDTQACNIINRGVFGGCKITFLLIIIKAWCSLVTGRARVWEGDRWMVGEGTLKTGSPSWVCSGEQGLIHAGGSRGKERRNQAE